MPRLNPHVLKVGTHNEATQMLKRTFRQSMRLWIEGFFRLKQLKSLANKPSGVPQEDLNHLAILPPHPQHPFGSRGDQAMAYALISEYRKIYPRGLISIVVSPNCDLEDFDVLNVKALPIWAKDKLLDCSDLSKFSSLVMIGADVMDGHYWPITVLRGLDLCERARIAGAQVGILGFSFNNSPELNCVKALKQLNTEIRLFARDPKSEKRFANYVAPKATLVADAAFWMAARDSIYVKQLDDWCAKQEESGLSVIGFNLHSLLLDVPGTCGIQDAVLNTTRAISEIVSKNKVSVLLIPHDFRGNTNDRSILKQIWNELDADLKNRVFIPESEFKADELKAIAAKCSIVLTGRMHLAIASLGMGVPVAAIAYQDKFEGLFDHFNLPYKHILQPTDLSRHEAIYSWMQKAIDESIELKNIVSVNLPKVLELSHKNFSWLC